MKNIIFSMIFLCYYNSKYFASEPFFIEEMEEKKGGNLGVKKRKNWYKKVN